MNPLDRQELQPFLRNLKEEMPIHTHNTAKIKRSYSQGMPKNLMDYSAFVNNHFLNDNLAIIEEMQHRNKQHPIPKWFRDYQIRHYAKYGILKGDHFFGPFAKIFPDLGEHRGIGFLPYAGMTLGFGTIGDTKVPGSTITIGDQTANSAGNTGYIIAPAISGLTDQAWYDQMAIDLFAAAGNQRLAIYSDSTGPDSLISESASVPCATGFPFVPITPFFNTVVGTQWLAYQVDNGSTNTYRSNSGTRKLHTFTYGAMNNPFGSLDISQSITDHMKIGYS